MNIIIQVINVPGYKSAISFGLVHIPVSLNPVISNNDTSFNMLHKDCLKRVKYKKYCYTCDEEVKNDDLVKGYRYAPDNYVTFDDEDFEKLKTENDRTIEIISFVDLKEIDPIYFEKSYYLVTDGKNRAFSLFKAALKSQNKVAIAKTVLGNKSYYVILRFGGNNIIMSTLFFEEEIRLFEDTDDETFTKKEMDLAAELINNMTGKFRPEEYSDEYQNKIKEAIEKKIEGKEIKKVKSKKTKNITDLMSALEESLKDTKGKK